MNVRAITEGIELEDDALDEFCKDRVKTSLRYDEIAKFLLNRFFCII